MIYVLLLSTINQGHLPWRTRLSTLSAIAAIGLLTGSLTAQRLALLMP